MEPGAGAAARVVWALTRVGVSAPPVRMASMLDWRRFDPGSLERAAQMLVRDRFGATSVDGAGGDEAQDLRWESPDGLVIFEVKSFCDRLRSAQKRQIEASLIRAVSCHHSARWALVLPVNPSPAELKWFDDLRRRFPDVELEWLGIDWLDAQVAGREDVISYLEGPDYKLLRRARQLELEHAAAATGDEVSARMAQLAARGEEISPYWAWDVRTTAGGQIRALRAKREESAALDPIMLKTRFSFPPDDPDAAETAQNVDQVLRFGGDVTIAGQFIDRFAVEASSEATRRLVGHTVGERQRRVLPRLRPRRAARHLRRQLLRRRRPVASRVDTRHARRFRDRAERRGELSLPPGARRDVHGSRDGARRRRSRLDVGRRRR